MKQINKKYKILKNIKIKYFIEKYKFTLYNLF